MNEDDDGDNEIKTNIVSRECDKALNWMDYADFKRILANHGIDVSSSESEDDLKAAVRANIEDGEISEDEILGN